METRDRLINLNSAEEHELTQLPAIGADKAKRIILGRTIRKGFRDWEDFARTSGIPREDVQAIQTRAWIGPAPAEPDGTPAPRRAGRRPTAIRRPRR